MLPFWISKKTPVSCDRMQFSSYEWEEGIFTFKWNGHHYQDQLMEGVKKISQNETNWSFLFCFLFFKWLLSFCALARLQNYFKKTVTLLELQCPHCRIKKPYCWLLVMDLKEKLNILHYALQYCICFSKFVDWGMGKTKNYT